MIARLKKFWNLPGRQKLVLSRAFVLLGLYRVGLSFFSLKYLTRRLEHLAQAGPPASLVGDQLAQAQLLGQLVSIAAAYTPWKSRCLCQVLVLQRLLAGEGIPGQFYLGVCRSGSSASANTRLEAHAWLQCGTEIVSGAAGHEQFQVVSAYRWAPSRARVDAQAIEPNASAAERGN
ncbi:MAG: lasso peptide biosynthesis B2 protein [Cyanobacteria bacterium P01_F01_bin.3]